VITRQRARLKRILAEADGYLELGMPQQALVAIDRLESEANRHSRALYLRGEALKELGRFEEAIEPLLNAADQAPSNLSTWLALGWCYKRTGRLDLAIDSLERATEFNDSEAIIPYNLACYYSLSHDKARALDCLARSFTMNANYREMVAHERDFDPIRDDPEFQSLIESTIV
jgi:Flp pilus assembly protein TadD